MGRKNARDKGIGCYERAMPCNGSQNENSARRKKVRKGGDRKGWNRKMPMLKALTVMKRQWFAMEAKIEIPCGEKKGIKCRQRTREAR